MMKLEVEGISVTDSLLYIRFIPSALTALVEIPLAQLVVYWLTQRDVPGSNPIEDIAFSGDRYALNYCHTTSIAVVFFTSSDQKVTVNGFTRSCYVV